MIIDGEKWACEACVRGHRVSNCQHSDRPLQHINKKGRPVSQCQHCRAMRKSRSAHVKCDCGEKTSKCQHLQPVVEGHSETCCCNHGGRCSCAHKKEMQPTLDPVPESDSEGDARNKGGMARPKLAARRRRAATIHSDSMLSFDANGNRKPPSKNRTSNKIGPYQLNRVNSANSATSMGSESMAEARVRQAMGGQRRVKSEATSPLMSGTGFQHMSSTVPPLDLSRIEYPAYMANGSFDLFGAGFSPDQEAPMYSAGLSAASVDWNAYEFPATYGQSGAPTFSSYADFSSSEQVPNLANTTSTSGDVSEVEDYMPGGESEAYNANYMRPNMINNNAADLSSIDYDSFYKNPEQNSVPANNMSMVEEDPAFWMPNYHEGMIDESPDPLGPNTMGNFWEI